MSDHTFAETRDAVAADWVAGTIATESSGAAILDPTLFEDGDAAHHHMTKESIVANEATHATAEVEAAAHHKAIESFVPSERNVDDIRHASGRLRLCRMGLDAGRKCILLHRAFRPGFAFVASLCGRRSF